MKKLGILLLSLCMLTGCSLFEKEKIDNDKVVSGLEEQGWEISSLATGSITLEKSDDEQNHDITFFVTKGRSEGSAIEFWRMSYDYTFRNEQIITSLLINYDNDMEMKRISYSNYLVDTEKYEINCQYSYVEGNDANENTCQADLAKEKVDDLEELLDGLLDSLGLDKNELIDWSLWYAEEYSIFD